MDFLSPDEVEGIPDAGFHILNSDVRVVPGDNFVEGNTGLNQLQNAIYRDTCAGNTRLTEMNLWIYLVRGVLRCVKGAGRWEGDPFRK
ncbi:hypothetical protein HRbin22_01062 [Candidatus Thermoflexus japonica]|uniref:Uncharacterized protein n=1 Tax=Candidatus Thermoflexus japonica TaxID=2035417 RepID=A0A2H5Y5U8_9CHLR|nr:hypothetical protein HRbin22_01062 [Candidatus Thermoflexus japonica]